MPCPNQPHTPTRRTVCYTSITPKTCQKVRSDFSGLVTSGNIVLSDCNSCFSCNPEVSQGCFKIFLDSVPVGEHVAKRHMRLHATRAGRPLEPAHLKMAVVSDTRHDSAQGPRERGSENAQPQCSLDPPSGPPCTGSPRRSGLKAARGFRSVRTCRHRHRSRVRPTHVVMSDRHIQSDCPCGGLWNACAVRKQPGKVERGLKVTGPRQRLEDVRSCLDIALAPSPEREQRCQRVLGVTAHEPRGR